MPTARVSIRIARGPARVSTRIRRTSHRQGPRAPSHLVERMVVMAIGVVLAYTDRLMRALEPLLQQRYGQRRDSLRLDAAHSIDEVFANVREGEMSKPFLERMFHMVDQQAANDLQRVVPVPLSDVLPRAAELQRAWVDKNTALIRLEERAQREVRAIITEPLTEGVRVEEIRARIQERLGVVRSRAELIARDQTLKLYGNIQEERQTEAGIVEYTWSTSDDERVRKRHIELEGTTQRWDSPPVVDPRTGRREHPGGDFQCRCAAIPILPTGDEPPISETRPSRRPGQLQAVPPEEQELAAPIPDPVQLERERLAAERAAREAERERARAEQAAAEARAEAERQRVLEAAQRAEREAAKAARHAEELANQAAAEARIAARQAQLAGGRRTAPLAESVTFDPKVPEGIQSAVRTQIDRMHAAVSSAPEIRPLKRLELSETIKEAGANGWYNKWSEVLQVSPSKSFQPYAQRVPNSVEHFATTYMAKTAEESASVTFLHEYGHHLHMDLPLGHPLTAHVSHMFDQTIGTPGVTAKYSGGVTRYSALNDQEFWAESFAAYASYPEWLLQQHPKVYAFVREGLEMLKVKL